MQLLENNAAVIPLCLDDHTKELIPTLEIPWNEWVLTDPIYWPLSASNIMLIFKQLIG